ncbi:HAD family hydrolase [Streptosporangium sp. NPDC000396]|uniref:HAD family hydrolase n=1 Tax=Streptosporangium sp. NPDC000396 TaxID=3366185 RepID=UPI003677213C
MKETPVTALGAVIASWAARPGRGVIFDFNGTLSNDEPLLLRIFTEMFLERLGWTMTPEHYYLHLAGRSDREIIDTVVAEIGGGDGELAALMLEERRRRYRELVETRSPIEPATARLVRRLADDGIPVGIVTGAQRADVEFVLRHSAIAGLIEVIVCEEDVTRGKPDPEGFLAGARGLGLDAADILVFEDSTYGLRAARAAGMRCVGIEGTRDGATLAHEADAVVAELGPELLDAGDRADHDPLDVRGPRV